MSIKSRDTLMAKFTFPVYRTNGQVTYESVNANNIKDARRAAQGRVGSMHELGQPEVESTSSSTRRDPADYIGKNTNPVLSKPSKPDVSNNVVRSQSRSSKAHDGGGDAGDLALLVFALYGGYRVIKFTLWCGIKITKHVIIPVVGCVSYFAIRPAINVIMDMTQRGIFHGTLAAKKVIFSGNRLVHHTIKTSQSPYQHRVMTAVDNGILTVVNKINNVLQVFGNKVATHMKNEKWVIN